MTGGYIMGDCENSGGRCGASRETHQISDINTTNGERHQVRGENFTSGKDGGHHPPGEGGNSLNGGFSSSSSSTSSILPKADDGCQELGPLDGPCFAFL